MKNMKRFIALPVACIAALSLVACGGESHSHTFDDAWKNNANKHWHEATCGCADAIAAEADHKGMEDGVCDVCAYVSADHVHTVATVWSADANGHWKAALCHDAKLEEGNHDVNAAGLCEVCGYEVEEADVSTVANAIKVANACKKSVVSGSYIEYNEDYSINTFKNYRFGDNYLFIEGEYYDYHYSADEEGNVIGIMAGNYGDVYVQEDVSEYNLMGPALELIGEYVYYGAEDLVSSLYELAASEFAWEFSEYAEDGDFEFSFATFVENYGIYSVTVSFRLDATSNILSYVELYMERYTEYTQEDGTYIPDYEAGALTSSISYIQYAKELNNPLEPEKMNVQDFSFQTETYDEEIWDYVYTNIESYDLEGGSDKYDNQIYIGNLKPETALILSAPEFSGEGVSTDLENPGDLNVSYEGGNYFYISSDVAGTYELAVTIGEVTKILTVNVIVPQPTELYVGTLEIGYYSYLTEVSEASVAANKSFTLGIALDKGRGVTLTCDSLEIGELTLLGSAYLDDGMWYPDIVVYTYTLSDLEVGTYVFTATSTDNAELTATFTLTVTEAAAAGENTLTVEVTDTYGFFDEYTFTATEAGVYQFELPAGLGWFEKEAYENFGMPEIDFMENHSGYVVEVYLEEGEEYVFLVGAMTKGEFEISYTIAADTDDGDEGGSESGTEVAAGTFVVVDNNNGAFSGTYGFSIGDDNAVTVTKDGEIFTGIMFSMGLNGNWHVQFEGMKVPQDLGTSVLSGELSVMFGIITLTFPTLS